MSVTYELISSLFQLWLLLQNTLNRRINEDMPTIKSTGIAQAWPMTIPIFIQKVNTNLHGIVAMCARTEKQRSRGLQRERRTLGKWVHFEKERERDRHKEEEGASLPSSSSAFAAAVD